MPAPVGPWIRKSSFVPRASKSTTCRSAKDPNASIDEKLEAQAGFAKLPRNSCSTRKNNRCAVSGRSKAYYNKFGISRIALRELALRGQLPGVRKSSW